MGGSTRPLPLDIEYEAKNWSPKEVAEWFEKLGCDESVLEQVIANEVDGKVMDEIITIRDHIALEELGVVDGSKRHEIVRKWLHLKPSFLQCHPRVKK